MTKHENNNIILIFKGEVMEEIRLVQIMTNSQTWKEWKEYCKKNGFSHGATAGIVLSKALKAEMKKGEKQ